MEKTLLDYLNHVQQLEGYKEVCKEIIYELKEEQDDISTSYRYEPRPMPEEPTEYSIKCKMEKFKEEESVAPFLVCLAIAVISGLIFAISMFISNLSFAGFIFSILGGIFVGFLAFWALFFPYILFFGIRSQDKWEERKRIYEEEEYQRQKEKAYKQYEIDCIEIRKSNEELQEKKLSDIERLNYPIAQTQKTLSNIEAQLKELYDMGIIYGKYRSFVPMSMFCEYLSSGRCDSLSGSSGAYNLYESELRADIIIGKMDDIIDCLEDIRETQYRIYETLTRISEMVGNIVTEATQQTELLREQNFLQEFNTYVVAAKLETQNCIQSQTLKQLRSH